MLSRDAALPSLLAWAWVAGAGEPLAETLPASLAWTRACWDAGLDRIPLFAVHDLGWILLRGRDFRFASARDLARWPDGERAGRLAWEDAVLGRWVLDPTVAEAHVAIAGMPASMRDAAVAHAVGLALGRALSSVEALPRGNPVDLRAVADRVAAQAPASFDGWSAALDPAWMAWATAQRDLVRAHLPPGRLFAPEDLWEIAHLAELPSDSARLALRELNALAASVGPLAPSVARSLRTLAREVPLEAADADQYPAGGFDAVTTKGSFENLVRSEVAYVDVGREALGGADLFDLRWAEGELLYYTRDESPLLDARRDVAVVFDRPAAQRVKRALHPAQALLMAEALALALHADLLALYGPGGARLSLLWRCADADDLAAAEEERGLLALRLATERAHRRVELATVTRWDELPRLPRVVLSPDTLAADVPCAAWINTAGESWELGEERFAMADGGASLRALADRVLAAISRAPRARRR